MRKEVAKFHPIECADYISVSVVERIYTLDKSNKVAIVVSNSYEYAKMVVDCIVSWI
jgi:S-adenosylmethionine synthetase